MSANFQTQAFNLLSFKYDGEQRETKVIHEFLPRATEEQE